MRAAIGLAGLLLSGMAVSASPVARPVHIKWASAVPKGARFAPDSEVCKDGAETLIGWKRHISCGPPDRTVRRK